ncbi:MAG: CNNM domain-containing protein [Kiritimatiellaeota bacterium]|nr:CNNM domain-containing protein [Kiritimatiellota bacterium]
MSAQLELLALALCLLATAFFAGIETGLISINRLRLRHLVRRKVPGADILQRFLQKPDQLLGTTLIGTNIGTTVATVLAVSLGQRWFGASGEWLAGILIMLLILVACEYFPKAWFQSFPAKRSLPFARLLDFMYRLLLPLSRPIMALVRVLIPLPASPGDKAAQPFVTREELMHLASEGQSSGILTPAEHRMIHSVIELKLKTCLEIMIPRDHIVHVAADTPTAELLDLARSREVSRLPVWEAGQRAFIGIVNIADVLADEQAAGRTARDYMRPPQFVAGHTPVDHILPRMRVTRQPIVLVVNERMEVIGLVTLADVLDEVIGA